eukprot:6174501-Pleurochrysis_carterae.AAC.1
MCQHCEVCRNRDVPSSGQAMATQVMKDPPFPFQTVSIDHKTVTAPRGTIVDMLTRFVTAVPAVTASAEETSTILMTHIFKKYSFPMVIKSDNGSAFRNEIITFLTPRPLHYLFDFEVSVVRLSQSPSRTSHFVARMHGFPFLHWHGLCTRGALALRSTLPCPRTRMADVALSRHRIEANAQARQPLACVAPMTIGCWYYN